MTNHHCVRSCLRDLSTARRDLARDGFHAATRAAERRCPAMELNRLEQVSDVTATVVAATRGLDGEDFKRAQNAVRARLTAACEGGDGATIRCDLVSLYRGGIYQIYRYHRFSDTRLVWAPEDAIADFGGDPDNFDFPRYALDAAFLRVYENGKPAAVADWFPFSAKGAAAGELTLVVGHPGGTDRQLTVAQLETLREVKMPDTFVRIAEYARRARAIRRAGTGVPALRRLDAARHRQPLQAAEGRDAGVARPRADAAQACRRGGLEGVRERRRFVAGEHRRRLDCDREGAGRLPRPRRRIRADRRDAQLQQRVLQHRPAPGARRRRAPETRRRPAARVRRRAPDRSRAGALFAGADFARLREDQARLGADQDARAARRRPSGR